MSGKIDWKADYKSPSDQENAFIDEYLSWPATRKWKYLMALAQQGLSKSTHKGPRRIEWT